MLREFKTRHIGMRLFASDVTTTSAPSAAFNLGADNHSGVSRSAAGTFTPTLRQPYRRGAITIGTAIDNSLNGVYVSQSAIPGLASSAMVLNNAAGTAIDTRGNILQVGYYSLELSRVVSQNVQCSVRNSRIIWGRVNGATGEMTIGRGDFLCTRTNTGLYTITFRNAFAQTPNVFLAPISTSNRAATLGIKSASGCTVKTADATPALQDTDFYIIALGSDTKEVHGLAFANTESSQRKPRIVLGQLTITSGTPAFSINGNEFTSVTDAGVGLYTLNLADRFARECAVIPCAVGAKTFVNASSASSPQIRCSDAGGTAVDPTSVDFFIVGSDDVSEY